MKQHSLIFFISFAFKMKLSCNFNKNKIPEVWTELDFSIIQAVYIWLNACQGSSARAIYTTPLEFSYNQV